MPAIPSDINLKARWLAPMRDGPRLLEGHTLVIRDGRILEILPDRAAAERYAPSVELERPSHLVLPGLVNARTRIAPPTPGTGAGFWADGALLGMVNLLRAGITTFCETGSHPREVAALALAQGLRAVIGLPCSAGEHLTQALALRDELKGSPSIATRFAVPDAVSFSDAALARLATLAAELDAGILAPLHESRAAIDESLCRHARRPLQRLHDLGLLSPALTAAHATHLDARDIELLRRSGCAVTCCLVSGLMRAEGAPPLAALRAGGEAPAGGDTAAGRLRFSLGSDGEHCGAGQDLWAEIRTLALLDPDRQPWRALAAATCEGAEALGLESEVGTLEAGKWADVCCLDLGAAALQPLEDPLRQLALTGARELVSDVWVAGRQLLNEGRLTRLDWPLLAARIAGRRPAGPPRSDQGDFA